MVSNTKRIIGILLTAAMLLTVTACKKEEVTDGNLVKQGVIDDVTGKFTAELSDDTSTPSRKNDSELKNYVSTLSSKEECEDFKGTWIDSCSFCYEVSNTMNEGQLQTRYEFNPMDESDIPQELQYCNIYQKVKEINNIDKYSNVKLIVENGMVHLSLNGLEVFPTNYDCDAIGKLIGKREQQLN